MAITHEVYLNRIERLAKLIGSQQREHDLVLQDRQALRAARDAAVRELQQVKAERDELRNSGSHAQLSRLCRELTEAHSVVFGAGVTPVSVANLVTEIERLRERLRSANGRVDLANLDNGSLRSQLADARLEASDDYAELERLRECVGKVRESLRRRGLDVLTRVQQAIAGLDSAGSLGELDTPANPAPASEPTGGAE